MKIGIDIRDLKIARTGAKTYLQELIQAWQALPGASIELLDSPLPVYSGSNILLKLVEHWRFFWWKQIQLPQLAIRNNCTHLFCSDFFLPLHKRGLKTIGVLHDAFFWESPEHYNAIWLFLFHRLAVPAAHKANLLIVPTQYAKERILSFENFNAHKILVVQEAAKSLPNVPDHAAYLITHFKALQEAPYFLHVGVFEKRKNLVQLVKAFAIVHLKYPQYKLVLVGEPSMKNALNDYPAIQQCIRELQIENAVVQLGYLEAESLAAIYQGATAYIFPSLNEGFGLPVLEAFNAGIPVLCANNSALPEVAANAALYFDPHNYQEMAAQMQAVMESVSIRQDLIEKGKNRLTNFNWHRTAMAIQEAIIVRTT